MRCSSSGSFAVSIACVLLVLVSAAGLPQDTLAPTAVPAQDTPAPGKAGPGSSTEAESGWKLAVPDYPWSFPRDHWSHPGYRSEWWYFTGHLQTREQPARGFGYQFTFFRVGILPEAPDLPSAWSTGDLIMGHASLTDLDGREHRFSEVLYRAVPMLGEFAEGPEISTANLTLPEGWIAWSLAPGGTDGVWELSWNGEGFDFSMADSSKGFAFDLSTAAAKPLVFQGPDGYSRKGASPQAASQYYSFTRMETGGVVALDGREFQVEGTSWMDKEFGSNQLSPEQAGWDWFSLQLQDDRDIMLYILRDLKGRPDFARGTIIDAAGGTRYLDATDWRLEAVEEWESPETGARYPIKWRLTLPSEHLEVEVRALLPDQENVSERSGIYYWEGAVEVLSGAPARDGSGGSRIGQGYVELTGYGQGNRPPI